MSTRINNPERSRARILASAQTLFIEKGYHAVSMSAIAKHSGVTQSMIHHYFGSKEGLWLEVKKLSYNEYLAYQQELLDLDEGDISTFIEHSVRGRFHLFQDNPQTARLLSWIQIMEDPSGMETGQEIGRQLLEKIREAQAAGEIRSDVGAENVLAMAIALTTHWFQSRHVIENLTGITPAQRDEADGRYLEDMLRIFTSGLHPDNG